MSGKKQPLPVVQGNDLFDIDIFDHYDKEKTQPPSGISDKFGYDNIEEGSELWLFRVPADFDTSELNGKSIPINQASFPMALNIKNKEGEHWELHADQLNVSTSTSYMKELDLLLPCQQKDGAFALAPFKPSRAITMTRKVSVENPIEKAKRLRDEDYVPPPQPKDLKQRFHPYGFFTNEDFDVSKEPKPKPQPKSSKKPSSQKPATDTAKEIPKKKKKKSKDADEVSSSKPKAKKKKSGKSDQ